MSVFLNSFYPLCSTRKGGEAVKLGLPPYIDGSIRREPDFESDFPAITGLCRTNKLIPRLNIGDKVIYITNKGNYRGNNCWCVVALLQIEELAQSHLSAAQYYIRHNVSYSQNLMIPGTVKKPLEQTHQRNVRDRINGNINTEKWDAAYKWRATKYPKVAICSIYNNHIYLNRPPILHNETMFSIFNRIPGTQTPPKLTMEEEFRFFAWLNTYQHQE